MTRLRDDLGAGVAAAGRSGLLPGHITGEPNYTVDMQLLGTDGDHNTAGLKATAMRIINALPAVVRRRPAW